MLKKTIFFFIFAFVAIIPFKSLSASTSETYIYRSTVLGNQVNRTGEYVYEIPSQKTEFSYNESAFFLTRIFNITNIDSFSFRHVLTANGINQEYLSPTYYPHRNWWAEIYYWKDLGHLSSGDYDLKVFIKINGGVEREVDIKHFRVRGGYYNYNTYNNYKYNHNNCSTNHSANYYGIDYKFNWTHVGKSIRKTDRYKYNIDNQSLNFRDNEDVYILTYLSNIKNIDTFQVKYDVYLNGNKYYKTNEVPVLRPHGNTWYYNYSWANLGKIPSGRHEIKVYLKINGGTYRYLTTKNINVNKSWHHHDDNPCYAHVWTRTNTNIRNLGTYRYDIGNSRTSFWTDEDVKALTKISDIRDVNSFKIKHKLYRRNTFIKQVESKTQRPGRRYWEYNYTQANFGRLSEGEYYIKVFISINNGSYKHLNTVNFNVKKKYSYNWNNHCNHKTPEYKYENTILGTGREVNYYGLPRYYSGY